MSHRFFNSLDAYYAAVLAGEPIDTGSGYTDGDHVSWLVEALGGDEIPMLRLICELSSRVTSLEQARNVTGYFQALVRDVLVFNIEQGGADESGISEDEVEKIALVL